MIDELKKTHNHVVNSIHDRDLYVTLKFYSLIQQSMPAVYRAKCGCPVSNAYLGFCEDLDYEYAEGIIENICLMLEKQFWEVIFSSYIGSYRSIRSSLRHMLQLTCWMTQAVINKEVLTRRLEDFNEAMDLYEFQQFLYENEQKYNVRRDISNQNSSKQKSNANKKSDFNRAISDKPIEGITLKNLPKDLPLHIIKYANSDGRSAIQQLYGELSKHVHVNNLKQIKLGGEKFLPNHDKKEFHDSLNTIFRTHEIIFGLLIIAGFHELRYYSVSRSYDFINKILINSKKQKILTKGIADILEYLIKDFNEEEIARDRKKQEEWEVQIIEDDTMTTDMWKHTIWEEQNLSS